MNKVKSIIIAGLLIFGATNPVMAAPKQEGTCSVNPNPVAANSTFTITATANVGFDFYLTDPTGRYWSWPQGPAGTVSYDYSTDIVGDWTVTIRNTKYPAPKKIGECAFTVI